MTEIKRKKGETFESMLRRFSKTLQRSKRLVEIKESRFREKPKSHKRAKDEALKRITNREKRQYLERIGKLVEDKKKRGGMHSGR
ncbi:MAG: 30S ribosomal protein S21 [Parcubacteria group bacterium CG08_land_8_20_14_0_20_48_21]|nr:MAG: hypothetical protein AUK21_04275 [Parcubacteria group bacterium CG2_30_48_51]PIS32916.1 MAG: 30S ribosomal protein S21 [Parcubacteria group bacterium CG08_land_8_20_14_0_20_48_21]PIW79574.1 MAG: 30S ribosomal protein S21 [Parcubacteria group bacterium CG_4_8_14_3_um_filter_48_16]PIY77847.1 MAG: 30S ribosomal protein S21 [Parcubacteria group bacterium CG_4_10_14_0_8_um_filter_48_154]PIZ77347.1 MAG: 30S ribosomal protein S21 [bacterium CG_4_10_14_0_2_um_filter_48_144]PJC39962.1 MAG: 30S 